LNSAALSTSVFREEGKARASFLNSGKGARAPMPQFEKGARASTKLIQMIAQWVLSRGMYFFCAIALYFFCFIIMFS